MPSEVAERRVLIWTPRGRDATLVQQLLHKHGVLGESVSGVAELGRELLLGAGCAITSENELTPNTRAQLAAALLKQPAWSDFPLIVLSPEGTSPGRRVAVPVELGNVIALDRPVSARTLLGAVTQALRGRARQYEAREAIRKRDQFLAMLGHELRNPLGAITFATELLEREEAPGDRGTRNGRGEAHYRMTIQRQVRHLSRLVDDLLDAARLSTGKMVLDRRPVEIREIVEECLQSAQPMAANSQVSLVRRAMERCWVSGDPIQLEQVVNNLLTNAIKYTEAGGRVFVSVVGEGNDCVIRIRDQGLGIAVDRLTKIFELFEQADEALARSRGGLGIGLTLVKSLVEMQGGRVEAFSAGLGEGSEFIVRLPLVEAPAREAALEKNPSQAVVARPLRIVIVEDNPDIVEMLQEILELLGCQVHAETAGPAGLRAILAVKPDLALVDVGLPGISGYDIAEQVRGAGAKDVQLVAMTGYGQAEDIKRALDAGFNRHMTKPITYEAVQSLLEQVARRDVSLSQKAS